MYYEISLLGRLILNGSARIDLQFTVYNDIYSKMLELKTFDVISLGDAVGDFSKIAHIAYNACSPKSTTLMVNKLIDEKKKRDISSLVKLSGTMTGEELQHRISEL